MKNEPALQVSWSAASSTIPLPARRPSTARRTSAAGTRVPTGTPRVRASSAYRIGADSEPSVNWKVTSSTR